MTHYPPPENGVVFRPDSRNGSKDYYIDRETAKQLMREGIIHGDATNGGYMHPQNTPYMAMVRFRAKYEIKHKREEEKYRRRRNVQTSKLET